MNGWHLLACLGLVVIGVALVAVGGGVFAFVPAVACALMMGVMVWMMMRGGGSGS